MHTLSVRISPTLFEAIQHTAAARGFPSISAFVEATLAKATDARAFRRATGRRPYKLRRCPTRRSTLRAFAAARPH